MNGRWRWALAALAWMAVIFWFSSQSTLPGAQDDLLDLIIKKGAHMAAYALLWFLLHRATGRPWLALAGALLYAVSDEWHQTFVPGRNGWWVDVVVDGVGAVLAMWRESNRA